MLKTVEVFDLNSLKLRPISYFVNFFELPKLQEFHVTLYDTNVDESNILT